MGLALVAVRWEERTSTGRGGGAAGGNRVVLRERIGTKKDAREGVGARKI